ncbi:MAG: hypothetical protein LBB61_03465 [Treponema sp.]|jgi:hypothetical protein|nr:hypothetical protein [Treponema sp.]
MNYIPTREAEFIEWSGNLIAVSKENMTEWELPQAQLTDLETSHIEVKALYEKCQTPMHTKPDVQEKNEKLAALIKKERTFVRNHLQNNDLMTNKGREALRIPIYDQKPTPHPAPSAIPEVEIGSPYPRVLRIKFRAVNAARWGKPANVHGLECLWVIAETPPKEIEELLHSSFATRSPLELVFNESERGKRVYFAVRWESGTVKKGPWSEIFSGIIP